MIVLRRAAVNSASRAMVARLASFVSEINIATIVHGHLSVCFSQPTKHVEPNEESSFFYQDCLCSCYPPTSIYSIWMFRLLSFCVPSWNLYFLLYNQFRVGLGILQTPLLMWFCNNEPGLHYRSRSKPQQTISSAKISALPTYSLRRYHSSSSIK